MENGGGCRWWRRSVTAFPPLFLLDFCSTENLENGVFSRDYPSKTDYYLMEIQRVKAGTIIPLLANPFLAEI
jgi:hypothetical protein